MTKTIAQICGAIVFLALTAAGLPSCKGFNAAPKTDAGPEDHAEVGQDGRVGSGGSAPGTGGGTGGAKTASGGNGSGGTSGTGGAGAGTGGASGTQMCGPSQHQCSGACVDNTSIDTCGTKCDPCKPLAGATATCDGTACDFTCGSGMKKCAAASICVAANGCCSSDDCPAQSGGQTVLHRGQHHILYSFDRLLPE